MLPGHALGATGAGDVKLMAAVGAIVGPALVLKAFLFTAVAGGVLAIVGARCDDGGSPPRSPRRDGWLRRRPTRPGEIRSAVPDSRFAYGPAIAIGSVLAVLVK